GGLALSQRAGVPAAQGLSLSSDPGQRLGIHGYGYLAAQAMTGKEPKIMREPSFHRFVLLTSVVLAATALGCEPLLAADRNKVVRHVFPAAETGFDPAGAQDLYSATIEQAIFETLLTYDYLARPAKLVPGLAEAMPQVTDEGKTYTIKIRKGVYFTPDPAFNGKKRELVAEDLVYALKRLIDP